MPQRQDDVTFEVCSLQQNFVALRNYVRTSDDLIDKFCQSLRLIKTDLSLVVTGATARDMTASLDILEGKTNLSRMDSLNFCFCLVIMRTTKSREIALATRVISAFPLISRLCSSQSKENKLHWEKRKTPSK